MKFFAIITPFLGFLFFISTSDAQVGRAPKEKESEKEIGKEIRVLINPKTDLKVLEESLKLIDPTRKPMVFPVRPSMSPFGNTGKGPSGFSWRNLPLTQNGKVDQNWVQIGWGGFAVEKDGSLRTECVQEGMGLLLYKKEKFGDCQIRVVFKSKDAKSNSGVFVRIDDGILGKVKEKPPAIKRDKDRKLSKEMVQKFIQASEKQLGPWYAVHHGYEVQICDESDPFHRTGSIYSLAKADALSKKSPTEWRTMIITLKGNLVLVNIDGKRVTTFDPDSKNIPKDRKWFEPDREPKRPQIGYIGLQNHDPGDVVWFKEIGVRSLNPPPQ